MLPSIVTKCFYRKLNRSSSNYKLFHSACTGSTRVQAEPLKLDINTQRRWISASSIYYDTSEPPDKVKAPKSATSTSSQTIISQSATGDIVVKTETDANKEVTKITIERPPGSKPLPKITAPVKKRLLIDFSASYTERNFITPMRAMTEYLLKQSELESLPKVHRRSPYEAEPPITVYYRKDVEAKAIEVWGSKEVLEKELLRRELDRRRYEQDVFTVKRRLRNYRREMSHKRLTPAIEELGLKTRSGRVEMFNYTFPWCVRIDPQPGRVYFESRLSKGSNFLLLCDNGTSCVWERNGCNFLFKACAWCYTGSHSLFSESIHSLADTVNQLILAYGIHKSVQVIGMLAFISVSELVLPLNVAMLPAFWAQCLLMADPDHPYGYTNMRYVSSLISGVGIFCVGSGLSFYHGVTGMLDPQPLHDFYWAYFVLGGAIVSEGATLLVALSAIRKGAKEINLSLYEYIMRSSDPSVNVVLLEDSAAVTGVLLAGSCMALAQVTGDPLYDAVGSILVGTLLAGVASFIIITNVNALVGRSIPQEQLDDINSVLERDVMIRAIHDVKGIDIGSNLIRYKAEVDFDGRALTRSYLEKHDLNAILQDMKKLDTIDDVEAFLLKHGENIVDMLGGEIDRIELKLRKKFPQVRHCDLEIL